MTSSAASDASRPAADLPHKLLVVGWFPGADDPIAGRFVADQVTALAATGRVAPSVVSFESLWSSGDRALRTRAAETWPRIVAAAASGPFVAPQAATGPPGIPVLRLGVPGGTTATAGHDHQAVHRARALGALLDGRREAPWPLIHAHVGYPEGAAVADVAGPRHIPFLITEHATYLARQLDDPILRQRYGSAARAAARVIAVGPGLARQIEAAFPDLTGRVVVIPNTVDVASLPLVRPDQRDPDELLWVGYRREIKGMPTLLRAFAMVRSARPTTTLRLLGRSPTDEEEARWHELAVELGVADGVRFEGPTDRAGVARAMAHAACFVHPSSRETMGVVAVEALATGLPVVAADSGGVSEVLGDDPAALGALVPREDPEALAGAILATLARRVTFDPDFLRAWVETRYGAPHVAARLADLYDEVLAEREAHRAFPAPPLSSLSDLDAGRRTVTQPATGGPPPDGRVVVVAFDRPALDRTLPRWPAWVRGDALIVTRGPDFARGRVVSADLDRAAALLMAWAERPRAASLAAKATLPLRLLIRRVQRARLERMVLPALQRAVDAAVSEVLEATGSPALVVCLGGIDVLAAEPAAASGRAMIAPGALRWLGDARWSGQAPAASSA